MRIRVLAGLVATLTVAATLASAIVGVPSASGGGAQFYGSTGAMTLNKPVVGMAATPTGDGYWLVASDGGIFAFGDARFHGSTGALTLNRPIVGMAATPTGDGYWLVASDGGIFAFGDARFHGSVASANVPLPIVGISVTNTGNGYWLAGANGAVYAFGDAPHHGQVSNLSLAAPVVDIATAEYGTGYWLVTSSGQVFAFENATFHGGTAGTKLNAPILDLIPSPHGYGYWLLAADGGIFSFGDTAEFHGSTGALVLNQPVVGGEAAHDGRGYWLVASDGGVFSFGGVGLSPRGPHSLVPRRIPTGDAPLRVMTLGDSMVISMQDGLGAVLAQTGRAEVINQGKLAYGFTAQYPIEPPCLVCVGFAHYAPESLDTHVRHDNFDAVVMIVGGWDYMNRIADGTTYVAGSAKWSAWYREIQDDAIDRLTSAGAVVYWLGYPNCAVSNPKDVLFNDLAKSAASRHPGKVVYLDVHSEVCPNGPVEPLTLPDGTPVDLLNDDAHYTSQGAIWLGYWLAERIGPTFKLPAL